MDRVRLGATDLEVSRVGFGCAQLMGRVGAAESRRALDLAFDLGVNYYDTARAYGYGDSEAILGDFLRGKRDKVVLATKFGIDPPEMTPWKRVAKAMLRPVFRSAPFLRRAASGRLGAQFDRGNYSRKHLTESIDRSLGQLRTDHVDVLLIHDASQDVWADDEVFDGLRELVRAGKTRAIGVAADASVFASWEGPERRSFEVAQFPFSLFDQRAGAALLETPRRASIGAVAYQPFGGGGSSVDILRRKLEEFCASGDATADLRTKLARPTAEVVADVAINSVVRGAPVDVVLCSMLKEPHVRANVNAGAATRFSADELGSIRRFFMQAASSEGPLAKSTSPR